MTTNDNMIISLREPRAAAQVVSEPAAPEQKPEGRVLPPKPARQNKRSTLAAGLGVAVLGILCSAGMFNYVHSGNRAQSAQTASAAQTQAPKQTAPAPTATDSDTILKAVGSLILLPVGEMPTIARVSNPQMLQSQSFFAHAVVGDVVLMYAIAKKAILYDPFQNKIIEVASLNFTSTSTPAQ